MSCFVTRLVVIAPDKSHLNDLSVTGEFTAYHLTCWEAFENRFPTWVHSAFLIALWLESEIWKWELYSHLNTLIKLSKLNNRGYNCMTDSLVGRVYACYLPGTSVHWIKYENWASKLRLYQQIKISTNWVQFKIRFFWLLFHNLQQLFISERVTDLHCLLVFLAITFQPSLLSYIIATSEV